MPAERAFFRVTARHRSCRAAGLLVALVVALVVPAAAKAQPAADPGLACRGAISTAEREAGIPAGLLQAIGRVESGRRDPVTGRFAPWPWTINAEGRGMYFPAREAAIAEVRQLHSRGVRIIDVGCMQVNLHHHPTAFPTLEQAFDPLTNARYAARFLTELQSTRGDWARAAGHYHSQTPERAEPYRARVLAAWAQEQNGPGADAAADATALAALGAARGATGLANGGDRARIIPLPAGGAGAGQGRGLDAYRSAPIMMVGRPAAPAPVAQPAVNIPPPRGPFAFFRRSG
jgi:hypothetical protein